MLANVSERQRRCSRSLAGVHCRSLVFIVARRCRRYSQRVSSILVASDDIYVQVTATPDASRRPKSVVVLIPRKIIEEYKSTKATKKFDDHSIARHLANPLAMYLFTHRASFGNFKVAHLFSLTPPPEIEGESPEFTRGELKAWVL
jgi:hypothetical protein